MAQTAVKQITIGEDVKIELEIRKRVLSCRLGKKVNFDFLIRELLGW